MSLKAFHLFFMANCILAALGFGIWGVLDFAHGGNAVHLILGIVSLLAIPLLVVYTVWFLKKLKNVSFL